MTTSTLLNETIQELGPRQLPAPSNGTPESATPRPQPTKHRDKVLFYDVKVHGKLEAGETLYLYVDGTFEKMKHGR